MGMPTFLKHLRMIHVFVCRGDALDALRGAVCGIEFGRNAFLINTRQLKKLMCRSKSCLNVCFQRLGYAVSRPARDIPLMFTQLMPGFAGHVTARQWCVRKAIDPQAPQFIPNVACELAADSDSPCVEAADSAFVFDIRNLLNHPVPGSDRSLIRIPSLPPFRC
jgi:hypothetical protein